MKKPEFSQSNSVLSGRTEIPAAANDSSEARNIFTLLNTKEQTSSLPLKLLGKPFPQKELITLHQAIETALPDKECRIIQFTGCNFKEGTTKIGIELSRFVSGALGYKTLFIDTHPGSSTVGSFHAKSLPGLLDASSSSFASAVAKASAAGLPFDYAYLTADTSMSAILPHQEKIKQLLSTLRTQYTMIVFHASGILTNPIGVMMSKLMDGVVLVIEAERTRAPAAKQANQFLMEKGVKVIGLAFNKRRQHIPAWAYRWL